MHFICAVVLIFVYCMNMCMHIADYSYVVCVFCHGEILFFDVKREQRFLQRKKRTVKINIKCFLSQSLKLSFNHFLGSGEFLKIYSQQS